jgi:hypothetical protein
MELAYPNGLEKSREEKAAAKQPTKFSKAEEAPATEAKCCQRGNP